ncbi:tetratricopeptide repeat protein [uncultured Dokdonia sp.]|uniref:tetratricopeptide repeat protein n=1 Tax=uncultured Dokdonia sp. TaxID=575653 RepID=UPI00262D37AE|nr:tetratricopeptide repeat protein [uncultured Dokdonia sp.]
MSSLFITISYGQTPYLDSLKVTLDKVSTGKEKLSILQEIASVNKDSIRDSAEAYIYYDKARVVAIQEKDTIAIRNAIYNLGEILIEMEEYDMAITYFNLVKKNLIKEEESSDVLALIYKNLGEVYIRKGEYDTANSFLDKGVIYADKINNDYQKALNHVYKSEVYYKLDDYASSERQISKAFSFFGSENVPMVAYYFKGKLLYKLEDTQNAISCFRKAVALAEKENNVVVKSKVLQLLADAYLTSGNKEMALEYSKNALILVDSLNDINKRTALARIGYIHAFESVLDKNKEQQQKDKVVQEEDRKRRMIIYVVCSIIGLSLIGYFSYRQNKVMRMVADMRKAQMDLVEKKQQEYL